jgi:hypothetical protein
LTPQLATGCVDFVAFALAEANLDARGFKNLFELPN